MAARSVQRSSSVVDTTSEGRRVVYPARPERARENAPRQLPWRAMSQPWTIVSERVHRRRRWRDHPGRRAGFLHLRTDRQHARQLSPRLVLPGHPFLSELCLRVNGERPEPLAATTTDPFSAAFVLRAQPRGGGPTPTSWSSATATSVGACGRTSSCATRPRAGVLRARAHRRRRLRRPVRGQGKAGRSAGHLEHRRGRHASRVVPAGPSAAARDLDFSQTAVAVNEPRAFDVLVPPGADWSGCLQVTPVVDGQEVTPRFLCGRPVERSTPVARLESWLRSLPDDHDGHEASARCSTARPRTLPPCGSSTPSTPTARSSPPVRRGS